MDCNNRKPEPNLVAQEGIEPQPLAYETSHLPIDCTALYLC